MSEVAKEHYIRRFVQEIANLTLSWHAISNVYELYLTYLLDFISHCRTMAGTNPPIKPDGIKNEARRNVQDSTEEAGH